MPSTLLVCAIAHACAAHEQAAGPRTDGPAAEPPARDALQAELERRMHAEFAAAAQARDAIVAGHLDQAREPLIWLAANEVMRPLPEQWTRAARLMQGAAAAAVHAGTLSSASSAVAQMAVACGECHRSLQRNVFFPIARDGDEGQFATKNVELRARMHQHAWISERLWQGLIGPWDGAWDAGCRELKALRADSALPATLNAQIAQLKRLEGAGCDTTNPHARAATYARIISACGECHAALAVGAPAPAP